MLNRRVSRFATTVVVVLVALPFAGCTDSPPVIELSSSDAVELSPNEVRSSVAYDFLLAVRTLDDELLRRSVCDSTASSDELDAMRQRLSGLPIEQRFGSIESDSPIEAELYVYAVEMNGLEGVLTLEVGPNCITNISVDNQQLAPLLVPGPTVG